MPLYEYQCKHCSHRFEVIQKFSDEPLAACPKCGKEVERLISSPAIQFKGTGWYITDYARKSPPGAAEQEQSTDKGAGAEAKDGAAKAPAADKATASPETTAKTTAPGKG